MTGPLPSAAEAAELLAIFTLPERPRTMPENQEVVEVDDEVDEREGTVAVDAERSISERYYGTSSMSPIQADFTRERERERDL